MNPKMMLIASAVYGLSGVVVSSGLAADKSSPSVSQTMEGIVDKARESFGGSTGGSRTTRQAVDINTASLDELQNLPGVGRAHANRIVENRPYLRTDELLTKNILPKETYNKVRGHIIASRTKEAIEEETARKNEARRKAAREENLRKREAQRKAAKTKAKEEPGLTDQVSEAIKSLTDKSDKK